MNDVSRRPRSSAAERALWVQRFSRSGLSPRGFAAKHVLKLSTLQRWIAQHPAASSGIGESVSNPVAPQRTGSVSAPAAAPVFAEVKWPGSATASARWAAELIRPDGSMLRLAHDVSSALLGQLLRSC